jgi:hypothetical protein
MELKLVRSKLIISARGGSVPSLPRVIRHAILLDLKRAV